MMCAEQAKLFSLINQYSFMVDDLGLYLNTHPTCKKALAAYNHFKRLREEVLEEYQCKYGPICKYDVEDDDCYDWVNKPWPWEGVCG